MKFICNCILLLKISLFRIWAQTGISGLWKIKVNRGLQREKMFVKESMRTYFLFDVKGKKNRYLSVQSKAQLSWSQICKEARCMFRFSRGQFISKGIFGAFKSTIKPKIVLRKFLPYSLKKGWLEMVLILLVSGYEIIKRLFFYSTSF